MTRQIQIDIEAAQGVGAEHAVERSRKYIPRIDWRDPHPPPWYGNSTEGEVAQLHLAGLQAAANPPHLPLKFDARALRADALRGGGRQDRRFGAGIEKKSDSRSVGEQGNDRCVTQCRDGRLAQSHRPATAGPIRGRW